MNFNRRSFGWCLAFVGFTGAFGFAFLFDPSVVSADGTRIVNLGLLSDRQNGLMFCGFTGLAWLVLALLSPAQTFTPPAGVAPSEDPFDGSRMPSSRGVLIRRVGIFGVLVAVAVGLLYAWAFLAP